MSTFISKLLFFSSFCVLVFSLLISLYSYQCAKEMNQGEGQLVFLGDSHFQNGIDANRFFPGSSNFSNSGETYFTSLTKLEFLLNKKGTVKTLCIAYGPHNISKKIDSLWVYNKENLLATYRSLSPVIARERMIEFVNMLGFSPIIYLEFLGEMMYQSLYSIERQLILGKFPYLGGYEPNNGMLKKNKLTPGEFKKSTTEYSLVQLYYLKEIVKICQKEGIKLYYVNTPLYHGHQVTHPIMVDPTCYGTLLDYGDLFKGKSEYFADYVHLNQNGAEVFSKVMQEKLKDGVH